jgi:plastocyanin
MPIERRRPRPASVLVRAALVAVLMALLTAPIALARDVDVDIVDFEYVPDRITISVGDTITWTNLDSVAHTATSTSGAFDTGLLESGASARTRFTVAGRYPFLCTPHPDMTGLVIVRAASAARPPDTDTGTERVATSTAADPVVLTDPRLLVVAVMASLGMLAMARRLRASRSPDLR